MMTLAAAKTLLGFRVRLDGGLYQLSPNYID